MDSYSFGFSKSWSYLKYTSFVAAVEILVWLIVIRKNYQLMWQPPAVSDLDSRRKPTVEHKTTRNGG